MPPLSLSLDDLTPFADLGTSVEEGERSLCITRNGSTFKIRETASGYSLEETSGELRHFGSAAQLLLQSAFANLPQIARNQTILLSKHSTQRLKSGPVPITLQMSVVFGGAAELPLAETAWERLHLWLLTQQALQTTESISLLLLDGPAGVGKTTIIRETALLRAENYDGSAPLILQIASRGRVLQNISDLIAFALQDLRSNLTVAQLVPLIRHGLVILAIDGFDELSDPNGFETAWSGLNTLLENTRGNATFLLAGRETFVSTATMQRQMKAVNPDRGDRLASLSLSDPTPEDAKAWLLQQEGWTNALLNGDFVAPLFSKGSYALRPFFLDVIATDPKLLSDGEPPTSDLLSYLVEVMIRREAEKFIDTLDPPDGRAAQKVYGTYVTRFLEEVARDLAENQYEALSDDALDLIAIVAADGVVPDDQVKAVVQRARTVVFLANDLQAGHVRFAHEQLLQHFLAREALRSVGSGEIPRYVRRNLFGRESLDVFGHVARDRVDQTKKFIAEARNGLNRPSRDRTNTNLAVLGVAAMCAAALDDQSLSVEDLGISELHFPFAAPPGITFRNVAISILHAAGTDISEVRFKDGVSISTLEVDRNSVLADPMPMPHILVQSGRTFANPIEIEQLLSSPMLSINSEVSLVWPNDIVELFGRIERYRPFWLRVEGDTGHERDQPGQKIIDHPRWLDVFEALEKLELITIRKLKASGSRSDFVHFRQDARLFEQPELHKLLVG